MQMLTSDDLEAELPGTHLFGHLMGSNISFDECIEPDGETVYRFAPESAEIGYSNPGQMVITPLAQACFSYPPDNDPNPSCFRVFRYGDGYVFDAVGATSRFVVTKVLRGIDICPDPGALIS
ncbi:hypothetical protein [uncultured Roseobacter sp.]|uniref:hypothetical protein n=1 Tax=uncultured Roseobacter sp. TaxID=114847 RepID=UPI0026093DAE|nr:hypothetical protein [uncultured Roseobacter sp.]